VKRYDTTRLLHVTSFVKNFKSSHAISAEGAILGPTKIEYSVRHQQRLRYAAKPRVKIQNLLLKDLRPSLNINLS